MPSKQWDKDTNIFCSIVIIVWPTILVCWGYPGFKASWMTLVVKNLPANAGDVRYVSSSPGWGRSPGGGNGNPFQCSCLENPMDRGAWWVHRVPKSQTRLNLRSTHAHTMHILSALKVLHSREPLSTRNIRTVGYLMIWCPVRSQLPRIKSQLHQVLAVWICWNYLISYILNCLEWNGDKSVPK